MLAPEAQGAKHPSTGHMNFDGVQAEIRALTSPFAKPRASDRAAGLRIGEKKDVLFSAGDDTRTRRLERSRSALFVFAPASVCFSCRLHNHHVQCTLWHELFSIILAYTWDRRSQNLNWRCDQQPCKIFLFFSLCSVRRTLPRI